MLLHVIPNIYGILELTFAVILFTIATSDYATALKCYILAGAVASLFFEKDVSATVWSQQVRGPFYVYNKLHSSL